MAAMNAAAKSDQAIAERIRLFRYRVPEEFYDLLHDPNCLHNLIGKAEHTSTLATMQGKLVQHMKQTSDPMLDAFLNRSDRAAVDQILLDTYGPPKVKAKKKPKDRKPKKSDP